MNCYFLNQKSAKERELFTLRRFAPFADPIKESKVHFGLLDSVHQAATASIKPSSANLASVGTPCPSQPAIW